MSSVDIALATPARLGECPVWSTTEQVLYWTDIEGRVVHRFDPQTGVDETRGFPGRVGTIALGNEPGGLVLAIENGLFTYDWFDPDRLAPFARLEPDGNGNRSNDGRVDPVGRFVLGTMYEDPAAGRSTGSLYCIEKGDVQVLRSEVGIPNGLVFDAVRERVYWADTFTSTVVVADYDATTGTWHDERVFFDYADQPGRPDGACLDTEGGYWSASVTGWCVTRVDPEGTVTDRIAVPIEKPSMPAFGGPDLDLLFVTTIGAERSRTAPPTREGAIAGSLLVISGTGAQGIGEPRYRD